MSKLFKVTLCYQVAADDADRVWTQADKIAESLSNQYSNAFEVYNVEEEIEVDPLW